MDFLGKVFFESSLYLGTFSFLLFAVVLFARRHWSEQHAKWALPITLLLIVVLFTMQSLVVTERETILIRLGVFVTSIENNHKDGIADSLSEQYQGNGHNHDHDTAVGKIMSFISDNQVYDARIRRSDVTINGKQAEMILAVHATVNRGNSPGERHWGRWKLNWTREANAWRIISIKTLAIDAIPADSLSVFREHMP